MGLRGHEDLAGGTRAIFMLERGFSIATGSGNQDHPVSRRTDLYVNAVHQRVTADAPAVIPTADPSAGPSQSLLAVGLRHHF